MQPRAIKPEGAAARAAGDHSRIERLAGSRLRSGSGRPPDWRVFLEGFLTGPRDVGSVVPSSRFLERRLVELAGAHEARTVVELGPGTGGTTRALLRALRTDATLLAIEVNPNFHAHLQETVRDDRLRLELGSAANLADLLRRRRLAAPDVIVSGIPFSTLPAGVADAIARSVARCLAPGGRFVAYQVRPSVARFVTPLLGVPRRAWVWRNVPPVRLYRWQKAAA